jgi:hypothetical protein
LDVVRSTGVVDEVDVVVDMAKKRGERLTLRRVRERDFATRVDLAQERKREWRSESGISCSTQRDPITCKWLYVIVTMDR